MTERAHSYYEPQAAAMKVNVPSIFDGRIHSLMPADNPDMQVSIANPDSRVLDAFGAILQSVEPYVMQGRPRPEAGYNPAVIERNRRYVAGFVGRALAPKVITGKMFNLGVEAVVRDELSPMMWNALFSNKEKEGIKDEANHPVFFVISGEWKKSRFTTEYRAGMAVVYCHTSRTFPDPHPWYFTNRFPDPAIEEWKAYKGLG